MASIIAQTEEDWELIVVDDGSKDDSINIIKSFSDNRIRIFQDYQNKGLAVRLNQITALAQAPILARMDADDLMHPNRLRLQLNFLSKHSEIDVVGSGVYTIDISDRPYGYRTTRPPATIKEFFDIGAFIHPTVMGRTKWFKKFPYDETHDRAEDMDLWVRSLLHSNFAVIDEPLLFYRELGLPYLKKYMRSSKGVRRIIRQYGPEHLSQFGMARALGGSYAKDVIFQIASHLGREDALLLRRNRPLDLQEQLNAGEALKYIDRFLQQ